MGFTDRIGSEAYNQQLSENDAQSVVDYRLLKASRLAKSPLAAWVNPIRLLAAPADNVKARAALIDCLAPGSSCEIEVKGYKSCNSACG